MMKQLYKNIWYKLFIDNKFIRLKLLILTGLISLEIFATAIIPPIRAYFFNTLATKDINLIIVALLVYFGSRVLIDIAQTFKIWTTSLLSIALRNTVVKVFQKTWVHSKMKTKANSPDQRITEDSKIATDLALSSIIEVIISGSLVILLVIQSTVNYWLLLAALGYTVISLFLARFFRQPLIQQEINVQASESKFRRSLVLIHLDQDDYSSKNHFIDVLEKMYNYVGITRDFNIFSRLQSGIMIIIPFVILLPGFLNGNISLGDMIGDAAIFELLVVNASILIWIYPIITRAEASWHRLIEFWKEITNDS